MASLHRFAHEAMATSFEIRFAGGDAAYAGQCATEAFGVIDRLEQLLSRFRENSEVSCINRLRSGETLALHPDTFECLTLALEMHSLTGGAFDPALGPSSVPAPGQVTLDAATFSVTSVAEGISLDLGAIGKGFALDRAAARLADWESSPALLIAGGSSILAVGEPAEPWLIGVSPSWDIHLRTGSIGTSGLSVKGTHILDPRTRQPAANTPARAWALSASAAVSDALSTAFMLLAPDDVSGVCADRPECSAAVQRDATADRIDRYGQGLGVAHGWVRTASAS